MKFISSVRKYFALPTDSGAAVCYDSYSLDGTVVARFFEREAA
jgi:hypothetical protein